MSGRELPPSLFFYDHEVLVMTKMREAENALRIKELSDIIYKKLTSFGLEQIKVQSCLYHKLLDNNRTDGLRLFAWPINLLEKFSLQLEQRLNKLKTINSKNLPQTLPTEVHAAVLSVYLELSIEYTEYQLSKIENLKDGGYGTRKKLRQG